jgi:4-alpha-glucanotransferase
MTAERKAGILLHPTSLSGDFGIGRIGKEARKFVDFLFESGLGLWQILPLGPTGYGDSPYQSVSSFAGNPYLIDLESLRDEGLISDGELESARSGNSGTVDFGALFESNSKYLDMVWERFDSGHVGSGCGCGSDSNATGTANAKYTPEGFEKFLADNADWLDDYALFSAIKERFGHLSWDLWPKSLKTRESSAVQNFAREHEHRIRRHKFTQYLFVTQWNELRSYAHGRGVRIIGDIPIFVAYDSADVWAHPGLFRLDANGKPIKVAGVPPDYFTKTGQLWGNPVYDWEANAKEGYRWWLRRIGATLSAVDIVRIDHFRGFVANWSVPANEPTAIHGQWEPGPGEELFKVMEKKLGILPIIAEDLGVITQDVLRLRESFGFPGMKILQFSFEGDTENGDYPHTYGHNSVVYTGTHDNDTCMGWYSAASKVARRRALLYLNGKPKSFAWDMIRQAWSSTADIAIAPLQDFLGLGTEARMNFPGKTSGWWTWRAPNGWERPALAKKIRSLTETYFRQSRP